MNMETLIETRATFALCMLIGAFGWTLWAVRSATARRLALDVFWGLVFAFGFALGLVWMIFLGILFIVALLVFGSLAIGYLLAEKIDGNSRDHYP